MATYSMYKYTVTRPKIYRRVSECEAAWLHGKPPPPLYGCETFHGRRSSTFRRRFRASQNLCGTLAVGHGRPRRSALCWTVLLYCKQQKKQKNKDWNDASPSRVTRHGIGISGYTPFHCFVSIQSRDDACMVFSSFERASRPSETWDFENTWCEATLGGGGFSDKEKQQHVRISTWHSLIPEYTMNVTQGTWQRELHP